MTKKNVADDFEYPSWDELVTLEENKQVAMINRVIASELSSDSKMTVSMISEDIFGMPASAISNHFSSLGYVYRGKRYQKKEASANVVESTTREGAEKVMELQQRIIEVADEDVFKTSLKMGSETAAMLDEFVKEKRFYNKQDIVSASIRYFIENFR